MLGMHHHMLCVILCHLSSSKVDWSVNSVFLEQWLSGFVT